MQDQREITAKGAGNFLVTLCRVQAAAVTPFLRTDFGAQALGMPGLYALILLLCWFGFSGDHAMGIYLVAWLGMLFIQRLRTNALIRRQVRMHTRYDGTSWAALWFPKAFKGLKSVGDPLICFGLAAACLVIGEAYRESVRAGQPLDLYLATTERVYAPLNTLAAFFFCSGIALSVDAAVDATIRKRQLDDIEDAKIESESILAEYEERSKR
jgi:hypothetical protein